MKQVVSLTFAKTILALHRLTLCTLVWLLFGRRRREAPPRAILVLRTGGVGDFLFGVPALKLLRTRFPSSRIALLTTTAVNAAAKDKASNYAQPTQTLPWIPLVMPSHVDQTIVFNSLNPRYLSTQIRPQIRALNPDLTFILGAPSEGFRVLLKRILFLRYLGVTRNLFGYRKQATVAFLQKAQFTGGLYKHKVLGPIDSVLECGLLPPVPPSEITFDLHIPDDAEQWAQEFWRAHALSDKAVVALSPGALLPHKQWPIEKFTELGQKLLAAQPKVVLVVTGIKQDIPLGQQLQGALGERCLDLTAKTSIPQSAALFKRCRLFVGNDGGAVQLATAVRCPCITLSNSIEYPGSVDPWFSPHDCFRHPTACAPCYSETFCPTGHFQCVRDTPVASVWARLQARLGL